MLKNKMAKTGSILLNLANLAPQKNEALLNYFSDIDKIVTAGLADLEVLQGITGKDIDKLIEARKNLLDKELRLIEKEKIKVIDIFDEAYPVLLKQISRPPLVLYIKGNADILNEFCLAIVGTRLATLYGSSMAGDFADRLATLGIVIVSGLARGIDTAAHKGALKSGKTIAVLGSGLLNIYPAENKKLAQDISVVGAVISEFPLNTAPLRENFPRRNRIVSGLSKGVLVVEAAARSGALITAHLALEQNREVFALPGKADSPLSKGSHLLIKEGAKLVDSLEDILEELNIEFSETKDKEKVSFNIGTCEKSIFDIIDEDGTHLEEILTRSAMDRAELSKLLLQLQLKGLIKEVRPACFAKTFG